MRGIWVGEITFFSMEFWDGWKNQMRWWCRVIIRRRRRKWCG